MMLVDMTSSMVWPAHIYVAFKCRRWKGGTWRSKSTFEQVTQGHTHRRLVISQGRLHAGSM